MITLRRYANWSAAISSGDGRSVFVILLRRGFFKLFWYQWLFFLILAGYFPKGNRLWRVIGSVNNAHSERVRTCVAGVFLQRGIPLKQERLYFDSGPLFMLLWLTQCTPSHRYVGIPRIAWVLVAKCLKTFCLRAHSQFWRQIYQRNRILQGYWMQTNCTCCPEFQHCLPQLFMRLIFSQVVHVVHV